MSKYIVIPDIHGQYTLFLKVLTYIKSELSKDKSIKLIFLGDYVNKGESSKEAFVDSFANLKYKFFEDIGSAKVVSELFKLKEFCDRENIFYKFLKGNQEYLFSTIRCEENPQSYENKLKNTIIGFDFDIKLIKKTIEFFSKLENYYYVKDDNLFFVHAGVNPNIKKDDIIDLMGSSEDDYLWIREEFFTSKDTFPATIIFGHTPMDNPFMKSFLTQNSLFSEKNHNILLMRDRIGLDSRVYINKYINLLLINNRDIRVIKVDKNGIQREIDFLNFLSKQV